jgi:hypothetical protein
MAFARAVGGEYLLEAGLHQSQILPGGIIALDTSYQSVDYAQAMGIGDRKRHRQTRCSDRFHLSESAASNTRYGLRSHGIHADIFIRECKDVAGLKSMRQK